MISVIIPNYNHAKYLKQRIDSILTQRFRDFELIILDDCSTDNSREIIEQYRGHERVAAIVYNDTNSGSTFLQWKKGIELARYNWVWIAESDDFADPAFLEQLVPMAHDRVSLAFCSSFIVDEHNKVLDEGLSRATWISPNLPVEDLEQDIEIDGARFFSKYLLFSNVICNASAVIFRKDLALAYIDKVTSWKLYGDWLFWIYIVLNGRVAYTAKSLNYFRCHTDNVRSAFDKSALLGVGENLAFGNSLQELINDMPLPDVEKRQLSQTSLTERNRVLRQLFIQNATQKGVIAGLKDLAVRFPGWLLYPRLLRNIILAGYRKK